jgi:hypothetical protein
MIGGDIAEAQEMLDYLELDFNDIDSFPTFENNMSIEITDDSYARLVLDPDNLGSVKSVFFNLSYYSEEEDIIVFLGMDNDLYAEWDTGIFEDNFRGVWGSINGELCYMEITFEGDDYNLYSVPVLLNGEEVSLQVVYDYTVEAYGILGAKRSVDEETLMADKDLIALRDGDVITPIMYGMALSDDSEDVVEFYMNDILVDEDLSFYETDLGDGEFAFSFQVVDTSNSTYDSDIVLFEYEDGEIYILTE